MSSSSPSPGSTVEHVVLFKVKPDTVPSKVDSMVTGLNSLASLPQALHLTAGPICRNGSSPPYEFTHLLHSRYGSKDDLTAYSVHPDHLSVVRQSVLPICDDIMAVDWVANGSAAVVPGTALRLTLLKVKEGLGEAEKGRIVAAIREMKEVSGGLIDQISAGENFSPERAKGFSIAAIAVFPGLEELRDMDSKEEVVRLQKEKVKDYVESVIVVDYVLPTPPAAASL